MTEGGTELKIVVIGSCSVGKTCIIERATSGSYEGEGMTAPTLGASYTSKTVTFGNKDVHLQIWDTAGQERYRTITPMYFRNAAVGFIVYAISDRESFNEIDGWLNSFSENTEDAAVILVGNKCDLEDERDVTTQEGAEKAILVSAAFTEVSAKTGLGIEELFAMVPEVYLGKHDNKIPTPAQEVTTVSLGDTTTGKSPKGGKKCC
jgi:small GTP-binding protein